MIALHTFLSNRVGDPETMAGFIAIAPAVAIVCTMSAFRGYMQGQRDMKPTAISQLIEQVGKIAIALPLALAWIENRYERYGGYQYRIRRRRRAAGHVPLPRRPH